MDEQAVAVLFPGQGAFFTGALREAHDSHPGIVETFDTIDGVAREQFGGPVSEVVCGTPDGDVAGLLEREPWILQLAIYGIDVAVYRALEAEGLRPRALAGHSFGELAALTCAGAYSVEDGAAIVCHRVRTLNAVDTADGSMAAVDVDAARAAKLVDLVTDDRLAVAAENHAGQTVLSGPGRAMETVRDVARALRVSFVPLQSAHPFHSPLMQPAVAEFAAAAATVRQSPLRVPVFSPILQRWYTDDDALATCLAQHLVRPVRFADAVRQLRADGASAFVECGASDTLSKLVGRILGADDAQALACLRAGQPEALDAAIRRLRADGHLAPGGARDLAAALLPGVEPERFREFWAARGPQVMAHVRDAYEWFGRDRLPPAGSQPPAADAPAGDRQRLFQELTAIYAAALEYPAEVFTEDVLLESELGIDSVKQAELLAQVRERYRLPPRPADFRLGDYATMGKLTDLVQSLTVG
jgi:acyl transferase domain-containing protein/acyl carrier protein